MGNEQSYDRASLCDRVSPKADIILKVLDFSVATEIKGIRCTYRGTDSRCENSTNRSGSCGYIVPNF